MQDWRDFGWIYAPPKLLYGCGLANAKEVLLASETPDCSLLHCHSYDTGVAAHQGL